MAEFTIYASMINDFLSLKTTPAVDIKEEREPFLSQVGDDAEPSVCVVVISYNSRELLRSCLASIEANSTCEIIVVDNASSDDSDEMVRRDFPRVRLMRSEINDGYGAAANLAIASSSAKYILLLNCDTLLHPGTIQAFKNHLDQHAQAAIVGPKLLNPDGTSQSSCFPFPRPLYVLLRESSLSKIWPDNLSKSSPESAQEVPWVLGAALAIRRRAFESVGGFDRSFFMYYEEVDLCYRLQKSGWQTHFTPAAAVTHIGGASTKQRRTAMAIQLYKSLCYFYQQHYSRTHINQLRLVLTYLMLRNLVVETLLTVNHTQSNEPHLPADDLRVWRTVLSSAWSKNGWLKS